MLNESANRELLSALPFGGEVEPALSRSQIAKRSISNALNDFSGEWAEAFQLHKIKQIAGVKTAHVAGAFVVGAVGLTITLAVLGGKKGGAAGAINGALTAAGTIMAAKDLLQAINKFQSATATETVAAVSAGAKTLSKLAKALPVIGLVITVGITWGLSIAQLVMDHVAFGSAQFMNLIAEALAATIVAVIMFAITSIPVFGQLRRRRRGGH